MELPNDFVNRLVKAIGAEQVLTEPADCLPYGYDNSRETVCPDLVVMPRDEESVRLIIQHCAAHRVPLTTRGRGTNTTGASVPVLGGVVLSTENMNRILEIRADDRYAVVQPGVTNGDLQRAVAEHGLFWPPDPTSADYSSVGGNLACNAGGPRAVRYGACRDNVMALRAIDGTGRILDCGSRTTKSSVGYDLTRTLIGSEGTLAIITEATLRLHPVMPRQSHLRLMFRDTSSAAQSIAAMMKLPQVPSAIEFMDSEALTLVRGNGFDNLAPDARAMLIIVVEGDESTLPIFTAAIEQAANDNGCFDIRRAESEEETQQLWAARKALSPALRRLARGKINEDVAVPVSRLPELVAGVSAIAERHSILIVNFGHAGNGNLHVNLLYDPLDSRQNEVVHVALDEVFDLVLSLDGTLSGEHGIGRQKRNFIEREIGASGVAMMRDLKQVFDPQGILNPGKLLPDDRPANE